MKPFPSIDQFRQIVREVKSHHDFQGKDENGDTKYLHSSPYPTITFNGTVKLHGTNAGIVKYKDRVEFQSRERVLSLTQDNAGFMLAMMNKDLNLIFNQYYYTNYIAVYGEWCGQGIQKGIAISQLPKMFVIFAVNVDGVWNDIVNIDLPEGVYSINQFPSYELDIDFNSPELSQNKMIEITNEVEQECPVGKHFGVSGIGEGVVWKAKHNESFYQFKVKGEKHSVSKVKTLASVNVEMVENVNQFVENVVTENRLLQGIEFMQREGKELDQKITGDFLRWVHGDVIKEEADTIVANQLDVKKVNSAISAKARIWFFNHLDKLVIQ